MAERDQSEGRSTRACAMRMVSATVRASKMLAFWNLRPTPSPTHSYGGLRSIERPFTTMSPAVRSPPSAMQRRRVVLPAPLGPTRLNSSPRRAVKSMPSRTRRLPNRLRTPLTSRAAPAPFAPAAGAASAAARSSGASALCPSRRPPRKRRMTSGPMPSGAARITSTKVTPMTSFHMYGMFPLR